MNREKIREILEKIKRGELDVEEGLEKISFLPYEDLGYAKVDYQRSITRGFPEVVFCQGKTPEQVANIMEKLLSRNPRVLATRAGKDVFELVKTKIKDAKYNEFARTITVIREDYEKKGKVIVACAGTADLPVAEEAVETAEITGSNVERIYDIGIAGLHRVLDKIKILRSANVIIAVAGMEGALPSVIGGLVDKPVIAVPTSIGYGANFNGLSALLTMLNSCVPGIAVVNIDNGFSAGYLASMINLLVEEKR
ncbi:MAG: nickel pincer cofactor biosynthesis protein LarB [Dictyoglomus sp.]|nr:nickel pincer cofactor biosynthesis protein LarB [Dictyoglomus sp.]MCX7942143.1 nickel pincer cofactor biosynthesis protein LarB [Dictyoglomaceae bacterium]MDW8188502.1 nickel pincer cofactor biosynthesis protein LarB [Dictyoglomus sp.]